MHPQQFAGDDTKICGVDDTPKGWDAIQRDLHRHEHWAQVNLMRFNKAKCKVLHLGHSHLYYQYNMGNERNMGNVLTQPCPKETGGTGGLIASWT